VYGSYPHDRLAGAIPPPTFAALFQTETYRDGENEQGC
jgi:hypothetical protein